jgi:hypothetical protein
VHRPPGSGDQAAQPLLSKATTLLIVKTRTTKHDAAWSTPSEAGPAGLCAVVLLAAIAASPRSAAASQPAPAAIDGPASAAAVRPGGSEPGRVLTIGAAVPGSRAFESLADFNSNAGCLRAGDKVLLEAGRTFIGSLQLRACTGGSTGSTPIEVRSFDPRAPLDAAKVQHEARIEGGVQARSLGVEWVRLGADEAPAGVPPPAPGLAIYRIGPLNASTVAELTVGSARLPVARAPDDPGGAAGARFFAASRIADKHGGCATAVCLQAEEAAASSAIRRAAAGAGDSDAYAVVRSSAWSLAFSPVAAFDAKTAEVRLAAPVSGEGLPATALPRTGFGFILLNSLAFLDSAGEWVFDRRTRMLYLAWNGASAAPRADETSISFAATTTAERDAGVSFSGAEGRLGLVLSHLVVSGSAGHGVRVERAAEVRIADVTVERPGQGGIAIVDVAGSAQVQRVRVRDAPDNGVLFRSARAVVLRDSVISNSGRVANQRRFGMDMNGVRASGFERISISNNRFESSGYAGVMLGEPPAGDTVNERLQVEVADNRIFGFCGALNDCGAIYVNGRDKPPPGGPLRGSVKRISNNEIAGPGGHLDGVPGERFQTMPADARNGAYVRFVGAVYLDHQASGYEITGNRISGNYEPYGWRVSNAGLMNACSKADAARCTTEGGGYACYTALLNRCNLVDAAGR